MKVIDIRVKKKYEEIFIVEPVDLGASFLTNIYKKITSHLKKFPFMWIVPLSFGISFILYFLLGPYLIKLVSILQYGF